MHERERLKQLENNCAELANLREDYTVDNLKNDKQKEWALRYGLFESIQIVIDISCHIVAQQNLGQANTYVECFELLHKFDIISTEMKNTLTAMAGLRNILVHEYVSIDIDRLYNLLKKLNDFGQFAETMKNYVG